VQHVVEAAIGSRTLEGHAVLRLGYHADGASIASCITAALTSWCGAEIVAHLAQAKLVADRQDGLAEGLDIGWIATYDG
jgi:hypothetical protein